MSNLKSFLKENKKSKGTTKYIVSNDFVDEKGNPLEWTIRAITTRENDAIREECMKDIKVGRGQYTQKLDTSKYIAKLITAAIVEPNLNDVELQNSYGVMGAENLIKEMVSNAGEYSNLADFVTSYSGFEDNNINDKIDEAKN